MSHRILAAAALLCAPAFAQAKTEAIVAFDTGGAESVRYYASDSKGRRALGEADAAEGKLKVDAVGKDPEVTAILVSVGGRSVAEAEDAEGKLFAFGDTVNARVRQASGGRRSIHGKVLGPVPAEASGCDLAAILETARKGASADLSKTDVVLVIAPKDACGHSGAATLGKMRIGGRKLAAAWAFGDGWVEASAHALEHAMGARHAAELSSETFGFASEARAAAAAAPRKASKKGRAARTARATRKAASAAASQDPMLTLASVTPMLEAGAETAPSDLRDAPAPAAVFTPAAAMGRAPRAGMAASRPLEAAKPMATAAAAKAVPAAKSASIDAQACRLGVRNLRDAIKAAAKAAGAKGNKASAMIARKRLAEALKAEQAALARKDPSEDVEVSLLTTDAETELHVAILRIENPKLTAKSFAAEVVPAAERAAASLEEAAKRMSGRRS